MKKQNKQKLPHRGNKNAPPALAVAGPEPWKYYVPLLLIVVLSFIAYLPVLDNAFLGWDDDTYIKRNTLIHSIDLKKIFSETLEGNYHPLTILILAIEYHFFGLNASAYHAVNLALHLVNVILVFRVVFLLGKNAIVALVCSAFFGIHPIHVESVAWAAEVKDLLYACFFLASTIFYLKYLDGFKRKFYYYALLFFLLSLLSKAMAASLPVLLVLIDYFKERKFTKKSSLEKIPFFLLAILFGIVAVVAQKSIGASNLVVFPFLERIVFACYGFLNYLFLLVFPMRLSAYYPYPVNPGVALPILQYSFVVLFSVLCGCVIYSLRFSRKLFFGMGFFAVTVFLVLQLLPVGGAVMADRYCYIPSIGIFYLAGEGFYLLWKKNKKMIAITLLGVWIVFFTIKTTARCGVWKNDVTLWNDVISKYPTIPVAYYNRSVPFMNDKKYDEALRDLTKAIELNPQYFQAYANRGLLFFDWKRYDEAIKDYDKAISINPEFEYLYYFRGTCFRNKNDFLKAQSDYTKAIGLKPDYVEAFFGLGFLYMNAGKQDLAIENFNKVLALDANYTEAYINRGNILRDQSKFDEALKDFDKAILLDRDNFKIYFNRGTLFLNQKRYNDAIADFSEAIRLNTNYDKAYYNRAMAEYYSGNKEACCLDLKQAAGLGYQPAAVTAQKFCE